MLLRQLLVVFLCGLSVDGASIYRFQKDDGRYFVYENDDGQFHLGNWTLDGVTTGSFGWKDANGVEIALDFIADHNGYRILRHRNFTRIIRQQQGPGGIVDDPNDPDHATVIRHFKYISGSGFRVEETRKTGLIYGKYGFVDANGRLHVVHYAAHKKRGFLPLKEVFDPKYVQHLPSLKELYEAPLRDVPNEKGLRDYYRSARDDELS
ncbi:hypothetical protein CHUAL_006358 [Chamberlinius hualienensis]